MSIWEEDENDGDLEPFDPAKSVVSKEDIRNLFHLVCKRKFIDLYTKEFPDQIKDSDALFKEAFGSNFMITESYVEKIITHYYYSKLPFEDDLETVNKNDFPSNKEIKRFFKSKGSYIDFEAIDWYCNSQATGNEKETQLKSLQEYFSLLKAQVYEYYPQLEHFSARGFRELERSLYTINYILWTDLLESKDRFLGINKAYYDEVDRKRKESREQRKKRKNANEEKDDGRKKWEDMTDEEKSERDKEWEEIERVEEMEYNLRERLYVKMANRFLELYPELNLPYEDFLAKVKTECWISYRDTFYIVLKMLEHFEISDEVYKADAHQFVSHEYEYYMELKEEGDEQKLESYLNSLDEWDNGWLTFDINWHEMGKTMLKEIYDTFPKMLNLSANAMLEIKNQVFGLARFNLKELFGARDRVLKVSMEIHEEWDNKIEEIQRKKFEGK